ncbi:MAG TPA: GNAT family N-acetyltransferase [Ruania sp.]|nr:GNAT family N-acetyltransferase [Ruania sp.]
MASPAGWACLHPFRPGGKHWGGAFIGTDHDGGAVAGSALRTLISLAQARGITPEWFSTQAGAALPLPQGWRSTGVGEWHYMWTEEAPPQAPGGPGTGRAPAGLELVELDDTADAAEIEAFGRQHNTGFEGFHGHGYARLWLGVRGPELVAVGAVHILGSGAPHLAGILTHPSRRGQGLGAVLVSELTRRAIAVDGVCTLGVDHDNTAAIRLYERLGYRTAHVFRTADLSPEPR